MESFHNGISIMDFEKIFDGNTIMDYKDIINDEEDIVYQPVSLEGKYLFISPDFKKKREYHIRMHACCFDLQDVIEDDYCIYNYDSIYYDENKTKKFMNYGKKHVDRCNGNMHLIIYDGDYNKPIYKMEIFSWQLKNIEFTGTTDYGSDFIKLFDDTFSNNILLYGKYNLYICKKGEIYPLIKIKRILDNIYFILSFDYIYKIEDNIKCDFIYYDELYYTNFFDDSYVFSQGKTYILSNSADKNAIIFAKYIDPSYECYEKKEVLLYREYYAIIHAFAFLITHPIDSIKKNIKAKLKKINLSHELWDFIYFEYFANMISLK